MTVTYEKAPEGHYRDLVVEYQVSREANLPDEEVFRNCAYSVKCMINRHSDQMHFILDKNIPQRDIVEIFKRMERDSLTDENQGSPQLKPYMAFTVEQCKGLENPESYERFYKGIAERILAAEIFDNNERYRDLAKWMKNNFEHFFYSERDTDRIEEMFSRKKNGRREQAFLTAKYDAGFAKNLDYFIDFKGFGHEKLVHPVLYFGIDAPVYNKEETQQLIKRFYECVKDIDEDSLRAKLDGRENEDRLKGLKENFLQNCKDPNPSEIMALAEIANVLWLSEYKFMYQGAPTDLALVLPRWVVTLEEEFAGDWQGSFHPLLRRCCNKNAYREEAGYIGYIKC